jgi:hypothetical protein
MKKTPDTSILIIPLEECTPMASIPGSILVTSTGLGIEGAIVVVGEYYYSHKTKAIEKRTTKRKREGTDTSHGTTE